ncbi:MAG: hypothetical protein M3Y81_04150 [Chloroflexota bacterium]|nr:hypothetical protein [Chloroflexota bacterium]
MSLIGDVEHGFSAVINGVEQVGKDVESLVGHAMGDLASLGIGSFGDMAAFVRWLLELGEDPVSVISALAARAASLGGDVGPVLSEVAAGVLSQGLQSFCTQVLTQAVAPIIGTLTAQITRGDQVAAVHQTTLNTMHSRLTALTTGTTGAGAWQGASPDAMLVSFGEIAPFLSQLGDQIEHNGQQASLNRTFIQILEGIGVLAAGMVVLDVLLLIVEGVIALFGLLIGPGDILIVGGEALLDAGMVAAEIEILLTLLGTDALLWLLGTLLIYAISHPWNLSTTTGTSTTTKNTVGGVTVVQMYNNPALNPEQAKLLKDLQKWLNDHGITVPEAWLKYLIGLIGTTGASIAVTRAMILCLSQKGYFDAAYAGVWNKIVTQLEPDDLQGAWKDGCGMKVTKGGRDWIHWDKVSNAYDGLQKFLKSNPNAPEPLQAAIQATLSYVNEVIDRSCNRNKNQWKDQARGPFWQVLLEQSGCANAGAGK